MIDARLVPNPQEEITPGEAVAGMLLNGLGFSNRPLSLTPQFFANKPLDLLLREGLRAERFNRFKLGRTLTEVHVYGCDLLCSELALAVCLQEGIDLRFNHLDTTSFALTGDSVPEADEQAMTITHGYAKDHRPDLQQAVAERMVSQDGGVPFVSKRWDGNVSDTQIFQERAEALLATFQRSPTPRYLVADAKLYNEDNAANLRQLGFITRIPNTLKLVSQVITQALTGDTWQCLDDTTRYQRVELCRDGMAQRWLVVSSQAALERAEASVNKARQREHAVIAKQLLHLQAQRFETPEAAQAAFTALATRWTYHQVAGSSVIEHKHYARQGRPTPTTPITSSDWQMQAQVRLDHTKITYDQQHKACFVVGTNIAAEQLRDAAEVPTAYAQPQRTQRLKLLLACHVKGDHRDRAEEPHRFQQLRIGVHSGFACGAACQNG